MEMTTREIMTVIHGMGFGAVFLLAFTGTAVGIYSMRSEWITPEGIKFWLSKIKTGLWAMAIIAWGTVISGTFIVYPWYRAKPPEGTTDLLMYPRYFLLANPSLAEWHKFGMEWKEHVGWVTPIAATVVAYIVAVYGQKLVSNSKIRLALLQFFTIAFVTAGIAGAFGAFITKAAPLH